MQHAVPVFWSATRANGGEKRESGANRSANDSHRVVGVLLGAPRLRPCVWIIEAHVDVTLGITCGCAETLFENVVGELEGDGLAVDGVGVRPFVMGKED